MQLHRFHAPARPRPLHAAAPAGRSQVRACRLSATRMPHDPPRDHGGSWCPATVDLPPRPERAHFHRFSRPDHDVRRDARL